MRVIKMPNISQVSVATFVLCGEIFYDDLNRNLPMSLVVEEF